MLLSQADRASEAEIAATRAALQRLRPGVPMATLAPGALDTLLAIPHAEASRFLADAPPQHDFRHWHWAPPRDFAAAPLRTALCALPTSVLRAKGFLHLDGVPHVLQRAGRRTELSPWHGAPQPDALVLIGTPEMPSPADLLRMLSEALLPALAIPSHQET